LADTLISRINIISSAVFNTIEYDFRSFGNDLFLGHPVFARYVQS